MHSAILQRCRVARRKRLLQIGFLGWHESVQTLKYDRYIEMKADNWALHRNENKLLFKVFHSWKGETLFLEWNSSSLHRKWEMAVRFYSRKILYAWKSCILLSKETFFKKVNDVVINRKLIIWMQWW